MLMASDHEATSPSWADAMALTNYIRSELGHMRDSGRPARAEHIAGEWAQALRALKAKFSRDFREKGAVK